ncbi:unnamed protein product [Acanthoscelides obtectus]|uniref:Cap-specific mRNA (nucleoside-2'-O-)-methyltransferase 2 n=1 Tax=Acanthoscelides obtectus TaxID=200917 RepID=A0A9P0KM48_ACAOB|nr:unnamed protein product [Acanthoscelides obtectus]CAK1662842.1 Cap-specific mRNA (nucleoside-2'-O-)-methyltransferase 2 [Acanthoscelides obtectus]
MNQVIQHFYHCWKAASRCYSFKLAWCKFFEMLGHFPIVPEAVLKEKHLNSVHLCEAPGAFVCSLNHYLVSKHDDIQWNWMATTLNPHHEGNELNQMIPDDRFLKYTLDNWSFGEDFRGDICSKSSHAYLINHPFCKQKVMLVTGDGSIDCMNDPGEQERHVEYLHLCEAVTAVHILKTGGSFVLKIFTMFEDSTICLLYLLTCLFEKVTVFKPCTSKSGNSEVYVINLGFKGIDCSSRLIQDLLQCFTNKKIYETKSMFSLDQLPLEFLTDIRKCSEFFMKKQISTILDNIYHFENRTSDNIYMLKLQIADLYFKLYDPKWIPVYKRLVPSTNVGDCWRIYNTFRLKFLNEVPVDTRNVIDSMLEIKTGQSIEVVRSSKFTHKGNLGRMDIFQAEGTSNKLYQHIIDKIEDKNVVINVRMFNIRIFHAFQKDVFFKIYSCLHSQKNVIFVNIPFVTHFLVGLLYLLLYAFEAVLIGNGMIVCCKWRMGSDIIQLFETIKEKYAALKVSRPGGVNDILQLVHPKYFDENVRFMTLLWNYNNQLFYQKASIRVLTFFDLYNKYT